MQLWFAETLRIGDCVRGRRARRTTEGIDRAISAFCRDFDLQLGLRGRSRRGAILGLHTADSDADSRAVVAAI